MSVTTPTATAQPVIPGIGVLPRHPSEVPEYDPRLADQRQYQFVVATANGKCRAAHCQLPFAPGDVIIWRPGSALHPQCLQAPQAPQAQQSTLPGLSELNLASLPSSPATSQPDGMWTVTVNRGGVEITLNLKLEHALETSRLAGKRIWSYLHGLDPTSRNDWTGFAFQYTHTHKVWSRFETDPYIQFLVAAIEQVRSHYNG